MRPDMFRAFGGFAWNPLGVGDLL